LQCHDLLLKCTFAMSKHNDVTLPGTYTPMPRAAPSPGNSHSHWVPGAAAQAAHTPANMPFLVPGSMPKQTTAATQKQKHLQSPHTPDQPAWLQAHMDCSTTEARCKLKQLLQTLHQYTVPGYKEASASCQLCAGMHAQPPLSFCTVVTVV